MMIVARKSIKLVLDKWKMIQTIVLGVQQIHHVSCWIYERMRTIHQIMLWMVIYLYSAQMSLS